MKKSLLFATLLVLVIAPFMTVTAQDDLPDLGGETITIAIENAYPPFNYLDEEGNPIGWDYDALNEICARINCTPEFVETSWDGMILAVSNGEFDMAADGITITEERAEIVDFSQGYITLEQVLLVRADEDRFTETDAFFADESLLLGVQPGTTNYFTATEILGEDNERLIAYETFPVAVQALIAGDVDAVILDNVAGAGYTGTNAERVKMTGAPLTATEELGFIFEKDSELRDAVDAALDSMEADGTLQELNIKWHVDGGEATVELPDLGGETITIAIENAYPPFNYLDEEGNPIGWDYDALNEICARINCTPEFVETSWDGMILAVSNGEFDMAADGITITEERAEIVDFSQGYITLEQVLLVRADEDRFTETDAFFADESLLLGVQPGTTNYFTATEILGEDNERLIAYETFPVAVQALIAGDVDAVILDNVAGAGYTGTNAERVKMTGEPLTATEELGFIFEKDSELRDAVDAALDSMEADGTLQELNIKWHVDGGEE